MAINENPQSPKEKRYGIAAQTTWGTAVVDAGAFMEMDCEAFEVNPDIKELDINGAHGTQVPRVSDKLIHTNGSSPIVSIPAMLAKHDELDYFLYAAIGSVVEGETTPYAKTFTLPTTPPNYGQSAGNFFTVIERDPAASKSTKVIDCISKQLTISLAEGEALKFAAELQGRGVPSFTSDPSGTWTRNAIADIWHSEALDRCTIDFGGGAVSFHLVNFELVIPYELKPIGQDGSGSFQTFGLTLQPVTWKLKVVKDADYHTALTNWSGNTAVDINVGWGNATPGTDDGDLDFALHGKINAATKSNDNVINADLSGVCLESDDGSTTEALTIVMANAVDRSW